jgi:hypothetical protein
MAMPTASTASVCMVIGTGKPGTAICADTAMTALPPATARALKAQAGMPIWAR